MKITFLGTGTSQGVPMIGCECEVCSSHDRRDHRLRSSVFVQIDNTNITIDTTPDFRYQMLREHIKQIDAILYTHEHKDHTGGMDDLRAFNYWMNRPMDVYCERRVEKILRKDFDYAFAEYRYPGVPQINLHQIDQHPFMVNGVEIVPIRGMHFKLPVLGFRIANFCYLTDMNAIEESEIEKFKNIDVLVINALRHQEHISHFSLEQALQVVAKATPTRAYITHISHQLGLYEQINRTLPAGVELAYDGLKLEI